MKNLKQSLFTALLTIGFIATLAYAQSRNITYSETALFGGAIDVSGQIKTLGTSSLMAI